jgi:bacteriocin biosynthesis cyclodehydratase domain-containing protein
MVRFGGTFARVLPEIIALLDGTRTLDDLVALLGEQNRDVIAHVVGTLDGEGLLTPARPVPAAPTTASRRSVALVLAAAGGLDVDDAGDALATTAVTVAGTGREAEAVARGLAATGVRSVSSSPWPGADAPAPPGSLIVAAPGADELGRLVDLNRWALTHDRPWLPVTPFDGTHGQVGPLVLPHRSACWECFLVRRAACLPFGADYRALATGPHPDLSAPPIVAQLAGAAVLWALRWCVLGDPSVPGRALAVRPLTGETEVAVVHRLPRCPACGPMDPAPYPWTLESDW